MYFLFSPVPLLYPTCRNESSSQGRVQYGVKTWSEPSHKTFSFYRSSQWSLLLSAEKNNTKQADTVPPTRTVAAGNGSPEPTKAGQGPYRRSHDSHRNSLCFVPKLWLMENKQPWCGDCFDFLCASACALLREKLRTPLRLTMFLQNSSK